MKNIALILAATLLILMFVGCDAQTTDNTPSVGEQGDNNGNNTQSVTERTDGFVMTAEVKSVGERVEVDVISAEYASGIFHILVNDGTVILSSDGREITKQDLKAGDTVEITYNGQVMLSYPPQVVAHKIVVK